MANKTCCVIGCRTASEKDALFFRVPTVRGLLRRWTDVIRPPTTITVDSYICNAHFLTTDYESVRGKTRLKRRVVPSIFDNGETVKTSKLKDDSSAEISTVINSSSTVANKKDTNTEVPTTNAIVIEVSQTEVTNTRVTDNTNTDVSNTRVTDTKFSDTGTVKEVSNREVSNSAVTEVTNIRVSDTEFSNNSFTEVTNTGGENTEVSKSNHVEVTNASDARDTNRPTENKNDTIINRKDVDNNDLVNESLSRLEIISQNTKTTQESDLPSAKALHDMVVLDDKTGAMTNSSGDDVSTPCMRSASPENFITRTPKAISPTPDLNKDDIEEILTNYHIKQTKPLHETYEEIMPEEEVVDLANIPETQPVFIEISVDKGRRADATAGDCLMLLESVQVDIDPSSLMLPERIIEEVEGVIGDDEDDDDDDDDVIVEETPKKKEDPISLLTSSDEDDVIIEEPDIDTVEVSDETDEDDVPLVELVNRAGTRAGARKNKELGKIFWGVCDFYCVECHFRTFSRSEYDKHVKQHSTVLQVCQLCGYTTASEAQFSRHKKKHKEERKYKCHLCDYKARHNMSLIYHLRTHNLALSKRGVKCLCGYKTNDQNKLAKHLKVCTKKYSCDKCSYATKRRSDLKRHTMRKHKDDAEEEYAPSWQ